MNKQVHHNNIEELLKKFHAGNITPSEYSRLMEHMQATSDFKLREILKQQWDDFEDYDEIPEEKISALYNDKIKPNISISLYTRFHKYFMQLAASLLILLMGGLTVKLYKENQVIHQLAERPITIYSGDAGSSSVTLPDGTRVRLNAKSSLSYRQDFGQTNRKVSLEGEGYFEVKRDEKKQFVVSTEVMDIAVLGTTFNVYAYSNKDFVEMALLDGHVHVTPYNDSDNIIDVQPNEKVTYNRATGKIYLQRTSNRMETAWLKNELVFRHDKLSDVFTCLERKFGVVFNVENSDLLGDIYTGTFGEEKLKSILRVLQIHYGFNFTMENDVVYINN